MVASEGSSRQHYCPRCERSTLQRRDSGNWWCLHCRNSVPDPLSPGTIVAGLVLVWIGVLLLGLAFFGR